MDFNERVYELDKMLDNYIKLNNGIEQEKQRQIENLKHKLDNEYKEEIEFNQTKIDEILKEKISHYKNIEYYSLFNLDDISKILINLISVFYNKDFISTTIPIYKDSKMKISKPVKILINKKCQKNYFLLDTLISLINSGSAIVLDENSINGILFYKYNLDKNNIIANVNLEKFPYLKEFIDYVISYKLENKINKITLDTLEILKFKFISNNTSEIKLCYELDKNSKKEKRVK